MAVSAAAYAAFQNAGGTAVPVANPAGATDGDAMVLFVTSADAARTLTDLGGWTLLGDKTYNTRRTFVLTRPYAASYPNLAISAASVVGSVIMALRPGSGASISGVTLGTIWDRPSNGGSINTTQAPSVDAPAGSMALAISTEVSTGEETEPGVTLAGTGWTKWFYADTDPAAAVAVNYFAALKAMTAAGATGVPTTTWPNNSNNSMGVQVLVTEGAAVIPATGRVGAHGCFAFSNTAVTIGYDRLGGSAHEIVLRNGTTEVSRKTVTHNATSGWGSAEFTGLTPGVLYTAKFVVDGVEQTDSQVAVRTLNPAATAFNVVAGSCQFTGSTHPVFTRMREKNPVFLSHMGDLHYQDAETEPAWRGAMESSLTAMKGFLETVPMVWAPDNHDVIRTDPAGGGDQVGMARWKELAGSTGWGSTNSLGRSWRHGRVLFIHTDNRSARDNYQTAPEPRSFLGAAQKTWFKNLLTAANADASIKVVVWLCSWTARNDQNGRWDSYPTETTELENHINSMPGLKAKMVMVGGDSHTLQADSGARTGNVFRFHGIPSLNMSGFNRSSIYATGGWDIAEADLRTEAQAEADWGGYSLLSVADTGTALTLTWKAIRVNAAGVEDEMATWSRVYSDTPPPEPAPPLPLRVGTAQAADVRLGDAPVQRLYVGATSVWQRP